MACDGLLSHAWVASPVLYWGPASPGFKRAKAVQARVGGLSTCIASCRMPLDLDAQSTRVRASGMVHDVHKPAQDSSGHTSTSSHATQHGLPRSTQGSSPVPELHTLTTPQGS